MGVWLLNYTEAERGAVDALLADLGWEAARTLAPEWGGAKLEEILEGRARPGEPLDTPERLLLFEGAQDGDICRCIEAYQARGLPEPIWAAVTPVSRTWRLADLLRELVREREALRRPPPEEP